MTLKRLGENKKFNLMHDISKKNVITYIYIYICLFSFNRVPSQMYPYLLQITHQL